MRLILVTTAIASAALVATASTSVTPIIVWNASESVPVGLYAVLPTSRPAVGDLALIDPPVALATELARRGYLPAGTPMLKRVAARPGQKVCRFANRVRIDGRPAAIARDRDSRGRSLARWSGCRRLRNDEVLVLNPHVASLDGRYFGPLPLIAVVGRAVPLWIPDDRTASERHNGR